MTPKLTPTTSINQPSGLPGTLDATKAPIVPYPSIIGTAIVTNPSKVSFTNDRTIAPPRKQSSSAQIAHGHRVVRVSFTRSAPTGSSR